MFLSFDRVGSFWYWTCSTIPKQVKNDRSITFKDINYKWAFSDVSLYSQSDWDVCVPIAASSHPLFPIILSFSDSIANLRLPFVGSTLKEYVSWRASSLTDWSQGCATNSCRLDRHQEDFHTKIAKHGFQPCLTQMTFFTSLIFILSSSLCLV